MHRSATAQRVPAPGCSDLSSLGELLPSAGGNLPPAWMCHGLAVKSSIPSRQPEPFSSKDKPG